jgi:hypothetical protein
MRCSVGWLHDQLVVLRGSMHTAGTPLGAPGRGALQSTPRPAATSCQSAVYIGLLKTHVLSQPKGRVQSIQAIMARAGRGEMRSNLRML